MTRFSTLTVIVLMAVFNAAGQPRSTQLTMVATPNIVEAAEVGINNIKLRTAREPIEAVEDTVIFPRGPLPPSPDVALEYEVLDGDHNIINIIRTRWVRLKTSPNEVPEPKMSDPHSSAAPLTTTVRAQTREIQPEEESSARETSLSGNPDRATLSAPWNWIPAPGPPQRVYLNGGGVLTFFKKELVFSSKNFRHGLLLSAERFQYSCESSTLSCTIIAGKKRFPTGKLDETSFNKVVFSLVQMKTKE